MGIPENRRQLTQIKASRQASNHTPPRVLWRRLTLPPEGSLLGLGVRAAHPFFCAKAIATKLRIPQQMLIWVKFGVGLECILRPERGVTLSTSFR